METIAVYGVGWNFFSLVERLYEANQLFSFMERVVCFADRGIQKQGQMLFGKKVVAPEGLGNIPYDMLVVAVKNGYDELIRDLTGRYGVERSRIIPMEEYIRGWKDESGGFAAFLKTGFSSTEREKIAAAIGEAGEIQRKYLDGCRLLENRSAALKFMPQDAVAAEVGVALGGFTREILNVMQPRKMYAIDFFDAETPYVWFNELSTEEKNGMNHRQWYERKFHHEIAGGQLEVCQGLSWDCLADLPEYSLDYVYIDANHSFEEVSRDIEAVKTKIKPGGYVQFNDYTVTTLYTRTPFGVVPAVNRFINEGGHRVAFFCMNANGYYDIVIQANEKNR